MARDVNKWLGFGKRKERSCMFTVYSITRPRDSLNKNKLKDTWWKVTTMTMYHYDLGDWMVRVITLTLPSWVGCHDTTYLLPSNHDVCGYLWCWWWDYSIRVHIHNAPIVHGGYTVTDFLGVRITMKQNKKRKCGGIMGWGSVMQVLEQMAKRKELMIYAKHDIFPMTDRLLFHAVIRLDTKRSIASPCHCRPDNAADNRPSHSTTRLTLSSSFSLLWALADIMNDGSDSSLLSIIYIKVKFEPQRCCRNTTTYWNIHILGSIAREFSTLFFLPFHIYSLSLSLSFLCFLLRTYKWLLQNQSFCWSWQPWPCTILHYAQTTTIMPHHHHLVKAPFPTRSWQQHGIGACIGIVMILILAATLYLKRNTGISYTSRICT